MWSNSGSSSQMVTNWKLYPHSALLVAVFFLCNVMYQGGSISHKKNKLCCFLCIFVFCMVSFADSELYIHMCVCVWVCARMGVQCRNCEKNCLLLYNNVVSLSCFCLMQPYLKSWSQELGVPILSVDYSLAPEAPFPRALEECFYAYCWALRNHHLLGKSLL